MQRKNFNKTKTYRTQGQVHTGPTSFHYTCMSRPPADKDGKADKFI